MVSSDDAEILAVAEKAGAIAFQRDPATATDGASSEAGVVDYLDRSDCETLCLIQCTSPLTRKTDFQQGYALLSTQQVNPSKAPEE